MLSDDVTQVLRLHDIYMRCHNE